jgi:hydrogenase maturation protease
VLEDFGGSLSKSVKAQIEPALEIAINFLQDLGIKINRRTNPLPENQHLSAASLNINQYEGDRPDEQQACRLGDERILAASNIEFDPKPCIDEPLNLNVSVDHRRDV